MIRENFKSLAAFSDTVSFSFLDHLFEFKKVSYIVQFRANHLSFDVSFLQNEAYYLSPEKLITEKKT